MRLSPWFGSWGGRPWLLRHSTCQHTHKPTSGSCPMNSWFYDKCKFLHKQICFTLTHDPSSFPSLRKAYCRLLCHKKQTFLSWRKHDLFGAPATTLKLFGGPSFLNIMPYHLTLTPKPCFPTQPPFMTSLDNPQPASPLLPPLATFS